MNLKIAYFVHGRGRGHATRARTVGQMLLAEQHAFQIFAGRDAFPVLKDLVVDRTSFDRIQHAGGYISVNTSGNTQDANSIPISKHAADEAMDAATCIGCGACVATCKNSSAMLFVGAKVSQYALLPQGQVEAADRVQNMVAQMDLEGFGNCTNTGACEVECPKGISLDNIARMNRELMKASI
mgnify:CR=1 FL=1